LSGESFTQASTSCDDAAWLDIWADSFWSKEQQTFFDVRIFTPMLQATSVSLWIPCTTVVNRRNTEEWQKNLKSGACFILSPRFLTDWLETGLRQPTPSLLAERKKGTLRQNHQLYSMSNQALSPLLCYCWPL
jgi:hypothetical protein